MHPIKYNFNTPVLKRDFFIKYEKYEEKIVKLHEKIGEALTILQFSESNVIQ
jgi:hypothetical protein